MKTRISLNDWNEKRLTDEYLLKIEEDVMSGVPISVEDTKKLIEHIVILRNELDDEGAYYYIVKQANEKLRKENEALKEKIT